MPSPVTPKKAAAKPTTKKKATTKKATTKGTTTKKAATKRTAKKSKPTKKAVQTKSVEDSEAEIIYEDVKAVVCDGDEPITVDACKTLLGYTTEAESDTKFGKDFQLRDTRGEKVRCTNNLTNRPIYPSNLEQLIQDILSHKWYFNGEPIIIGKTGKVLNGQHTLLALIFAAQMVEDGKDQFGKWGDQEPTISKMIVFGVLEVDEVVNTMDTCKPRDLTDVIYRSPLFQDMTSNMRKKASKNLDYAVRLLWHRTGASTEAFSLRKTHGESLDFIERHPKIVDAINFIMSEDAKALRHYLTPGYAAALLYLMGSSATDADAYALSNSPSEDLLDWKHWDTACDFWTRLISGDTIFEEVKLYLRELASESASVSRQEQIAVLCKSWDVYLQERSPDTREIELQFEYHDEGFRTLKELPIVGGIDFGCPDDKIVPGDVIEDSQE